MSLVHWTLVCQFALYSYTVASLQKCRVRDAAEIKFEGVGSCKMLADDNNM